LGWFPRHLLFGTDIERLISFALSVFWRPLVECTVVERPDLREWRSGPGRGFLPLLVGMGMIFWRLK
jgi:hypothetical protein